MGFLHCLRTHKKNGSPLMGNLTPVPDHAAEAWKKHIEAIDRETSLMDGVAAHKDVPQCVLDHARKLVETTHATYLQLIATQKDIMQAEEGTKQAEEETKRAAIGTINSSTKSMAKSIDRANKLAVHTATTSGKVRGAAGFASPRRKQHDRCSMFDVDCCYFCSL